jgi:hypothetical protein
MNTLITNVSHADKWFFDVTQDLRLIAGRAKSHSVDKVIRDLELMNQRARELLARDRSALTDYELVELRELLKAIDSIDQARRRWQRGMARLSPTPRLSVVGGCADAELLGGSHD